MMFLSLNSGGIDSPVAAYLILKKGYDLDFIYFENPDKTLKERTLGTIKRISEIFGKKFKLYLIDHESFLNEFMENTGRWDKKFTCVFCKRTMYRISEAISEKYGYKALVTGENLGQVASQTLKNLYVLEQSVKIPVLRPLLCMDKQETIDIAKKIGTYEISIKKSIKCKYVPKYPAINTNLERILEIERKMDLKRIIDEVLKKHYIEYV
ncbi:MAG: hypothetical protein J7J21_05290 [Methanomicrobia archaeon]|nr:hypothetical protein [Methanomicrobia archaeon]